MTGYRTSASEIEISVTPIVNAKTPKGNSISRLGQALPRHRIAQCPEQSLPRRQGGGIRNKHRPDVSAPKVDRQLPPDAGENQPDQQGQDQDQETDYRDGQSNANRQSRDDDREVQSPQREGKQQIQDPEISPGVRHQASGRDHPTGRLGGKSRDFMSNCASSGPVWRLCFSR